MDIVLDSGWEMEERTYSSIDDTHATEPNTGRRAFDAHRKHSFYA